jgi:hypothetical protein
MEKLGRLQRKILVALLGLEERRKSEPLPDEIENDPVLRYLFRELVPRGDLYEELNEEIVNKAKHGMSLGLFDPVLWAKRYKASMAHYARALKHLHRLGLVNPVEVRPVKTVVHGFRLTNRGREVAERIRFEEKARINKYEVEKLEEEGKDYVMKALLVMKAQRMQDQQPSQVTLDEIRETLWQVSKDTFKSREQFERYWTKKRLGRDLRILGYKQKQKRSEGKEMWIYDLEDLVISDTFMASLSAKAIDMR